MPCQFERDIKPFLIEINTLRVCNFKLLQILSNFVKEKKKTSIIQKNKEAIITLDWNKIINSPAKIFSMKEKKKHFDKRKEMAAQSAG